MKRRHIPAILRLALLFLLVGLALLVYLDPELAQRVSPVAAGEQVGRAGLTAYAIYVLLVALGICLFLPAGPMVISGAILFGAWRGFLLAWGGTLLGATGAFFVGRYLGRDFVSSFLGERLKKYQAYLVTKGFETVFLVRLMYGPYTILSYVFSLTKISFKDYFLGTALGSLLSIFVFCYLSDTLKVAWVSGDWKALASTKVLLGVSLFLLSYLIPLLINRFRKSGDRRPSATTPLQGDAKR